ncbi:hypothetical protein ACFWJW_24750 [Streptomyces sp. NPDC127097]|uniref:hypothetical protein n=1 Tax=Streptomyces sp. NPDC127097 TaxID=3347136 RepID=UPI003653F27F
MNTGLPDDTEPECPELADDSDSDSDSETLTHLRARVHQDYARRQRHGQLGRSL